MTARQQVGSVLRRLDRRAPQRMRATARSAARRALRRPAPPLVSVVVTATDEDVDYLEQSLTSVREQRHGALEILIAPHGAADRVRETVRPSLPEDYRLRMLATAPDRAAARERGVEHAHGRYLCFLRGEDVLPPPAVAAGVAALEQSGSDLAVGRMQAKRSVSPSVLPPFDPVHVANRRGITLADFPLALTEDTLGNRLFRTDFWRRAGLSFTAAAAGDTEVVAQALIRADRLDIIRAPMYGDMNRAHGTPVDRTYDTTADLAEWLTSVGTIERWLDGHHPQIRDHWVLGVLDRRLPAFLGDVERMSSAQWAELRQGMHRLAADMAEPLWRRLRAVSRVQLSLLLGDHREQLEEFVAARWFEQDNVDTELVADQSGVGVRARLPFHDDATLGIPADRYLMHPEETPARVEVRDIRREGDSLLLDLLARIELVDLAEREPQITARLVPEDVPGASAVPLAVTMRTDPGANFVVGHRFQDYRPGGCTVAVPEAGLAAGRWHLEVDVAVPFSPGTEPDHPPLRRTTTRFGLDRRGSADLIGTRYVPVHHTATGASVRIEHDRDARFVLAVGTSTGVGLRDARVRGREVDLDLGGLDLDRVRGVRVRRGEFETTVPVEAGRARVELPEEAVSEPERLEIHAVGQDDPTAHPLSWPLTSEWWIAGVDAEVVPARTPAGTVELRPTVGSVVVDSVDMHDTRIRVRGHWLGRPSQVAELTLAGDRLRRTRAVETDPDGGLTVEFETDWDEWGLHTTAIPTGSYRFELTHGRSRLEGRLFPSTALVEAMTDFRCDDRFRYRPLRDGRGRLGIMLQPPVPLEYAGAYPQHRLQQACLAGLGPIDPETVYLSVYAGASATDSQLAVHHELRRTHPHKKLYWGVRDLGSWVPEGGIPVVFNTPEWYRVLSTAGYLVQNIDFDRWWSRRPGQRFLQTFHGYPAKSMGLRMWRGKGYTPRRIGVELSRTRDDWDLILTPDESMDVHYRTEYAYDGPIHSEGYPRDDALVAPDADRRRAEVRDLLGIAPGTTVVLYAPTWREHLAENWRSAALVEHLDVVAASEQLGDDYVVLLRGHRFNAKGSDRTERTARLLDVTDYPEINDLILAADAAVLDYSSLRFDFALTEKPMVFLVPDLADYTGGIRGFLFDFADTAPGPMLQTADQVVAALRDLPELAAEYGDRIRSFNARYQRWHDGHAAQRLVQRFFGQ